MSDTQTGEVLGELKAFSFAPPSRDDLADSERRSWAGAQTCPAYKDIPGVMVRMFAGHVVKPAWIRAR